MDPMRIRGQVFVVSFEQLPIPLVVVSPFSKVLGILQIKMQWMSWCICLSWMRGSQGEAVKPLGSGELFTFCLFNKHLIKALLLSPY